MNLSIYLVVILVHMSLLVIYVGDEAKVTGRKSNRPKFDKKNDDNPISRYVKIIFKRNNQIGLGPSVKGIAPLRYLLVGELRMILL